MNELSLFTGAGGGILGTHLLGWTPIGYVELDDYCQRVLAARIADGLIPCAPIFGDIRQFVQSGAAREYRGFAQVVTAGFTCQPFSSAGAKKGADDEKNMWPATRDVIRDVRPTYVFLENVPGILGKYASTVTAELAAMGYMGSNGVLSAAHFGASHLRERVWFCCHTHKNGESDGTVNGKASRMPPHDANAVRRKLAQWRDMARGWWGGELAERYDRRLGANPSGGMGMDDGIPNRMDRLRATGQAQVPRVVRAAWELLS